MQLTWKSVFAISFALLCCANFSPTHAQSASPPTAATPDPKMAFEEARKVAKPGPVDVPLASQAVLKLPIGYVFIAQPQATQLLRAMGNPGQDPRLLGLIFPDAASNDAKTETNWLITVRFEDAGYIKDDDARDWNVDELLKSYREGTDASNEERVKMGGAALEIIGWAEKPAYDATTHRLAWAMSSKEKGAPASEAQGVNYNTYVLGREGYITMNLVTGLAELPQHKPAAQTMLSALSFVDGKRYADFNSSTDRVAEYGLAALVVGVAAKKLGFIAMGALFFAKFAKVILLALAVLGGGFAKFFKRRPKDQPPPT
jgi:uncharacterized membrane-anchored protein